MGEYGGYVELDNVEELDSVDALGKVLAEAYDRRIARDIIDVLKKYFPNTTFDEDKVLKLARMLIAEEEKGGEG